MTGGMQIALVIKKFNILYKKSSIIQLCRNTKHLPWKYVQEGIILARISRESLIKGDTEVRLEGWANSFYGLHENSQS